MMVVASWLYDQGIACMRLYLTCAGVGGRACLPSVELFDVSGGMMLCIAIGLNGTETKHIKLRSYFNNEDTIIFVSNIGSHLLHWFNTFTAASEIILLHLVQRRAKMYPQ